MIQRQHLYVLAPLTVLGGWLLLSAVPRYVPRTAAATVAVAAPLPRPEVPGLTREEAGDFTRALEAVSERTGLAILAEGAPREPTRTGNALRNWRETAPSPEKLLEQVAALYDYEVLLNEHGRRPQSRVAVLVKRYNDPRELPSVTLEECRAAMNDVVALLEAHAPPRDPAPPGGVVTRENYVSPERRALRDLYHSLTPEQRAALAGEQGVPVASLTGPQRRAAAHMAAYLFARLPLEDAQGAAFLLDNAGGAYFHRKPVSGRDWFGVSMPTPGGGPAYFRHLEETVGVQSGPVPGPAPGAPPAPAAPPDGSVTLAELTKSLSDAETAVAVDPMLAPKRVTLAGRARADADQIVRAAALLYGLAVAETPAAAEGRPRTRTLRRRSALRRASSLGEVPVAVRAALPAPLLRAVHDRGGFGSGLDADGVPHPAAAPPGGRPPLPGSLEFRMAGQNAGNVAKEALARLRASVEPGLAKAERLPLAERTTDERAWYALVGLHRFLDTLELQYRLPAPRYITDFAGSYLTGDSAQQDGKTVIGISLAWKDPETGKLRSGAGIGGLPIVEE